MNKKKAIALLSGGLDSTIAIKILLDQGIEIEAVNFMSPFCTCDRKDGCRHEAKHMSQVLNIPLKMFSTGLEYIEVIKYPRFGYGKNLNPCIDCRIFMLNKAKKYMDESGANFLITGEVLGQRPKSQRKDALAIIDRETGLKGLILRPLSAKLLAPTIPEQEGIVDRKQLLAIEGRGRKDQIALAEKHKINDYLCAGGGCLLTDKNFVVKLKDPDSCDMITIKEASELCIYYTKKREPAEVKYTYQGKDEIIKSSSMPESRIEERMITI
ncbi:hypothetical protein HY745_04230 [Candidatus Desantisbacteria bacterium]|nr:hypothetical protein [Candidatus Desantisbacteria bacterium]